MISMIAAVDSRLAIGFRNELLYWLPNDLKRFKALTTSHTIIMGRATFESFPKGALPNRRNVVLSRTLTLLPGAEIYPSLEAALQSCEQDEEIFIIGGASVYAQAMPLAHRLYLTEVQDVSPEADAFFPEFNPSEWQIVSSESHEKDERHPHPYKFVIYERSPL